MILYALELARVRPDRSRPEGDLLAMGQTRRIKAYFSGMVQGVGFRYTTVSVARGFNVTGCVRNLPDGRVHLVAEGEPKELDAFLESVRDRMSHYVRACRFQSGPASGEFVGFGIER